MSNYENAQGKAIIIGAGIVGLTTALELLEHGYQVEIFDQSDAAKAASWAGGGILSPLYPWKYPAAINQLAQHGKHSYIEWNKKLQPITDIDFEIESIGMLIFDQDQFDSALHYAHNFAEPEQVSQYLNQEQVQGLIPQLNSKFDAAVYFPELAHVRNPRLIQSLLKYLQMQPNFILHQHNAITKFEQTNRQIVKVIDQHGQQHRADHYIIASGAWSEQLLQQFNIQLDIRPIHGQMILYKTPENWLSKICMYNTMYLIPRRDGHVVCGSSTNDFGFDTPVREDISQNIIQATQDLIPDLADFPIVKQWSGLRPSTPSGIPKIGRLHDMENVWLNAGHYRNGLVMAPASARLLREQIQGLPTFVDAAPYQLS